MTTSTDKLVQGKAIYLELVRKNANAVMQVLIMPEGMTTSHKTVPMTVYRRRLSPAFPRKSWKQSSSVYTSMALLTGVAPVAKEEVPGKILGFLDSMFISLGANDYELYKEPIVVEVTAEDLEFARQGKTPYKVMGRVTKVRKALGFPKDIVRTSPTTTVM